MRKTWLIVKNGMSKFNNKRSIPQIFIINGTLKTDKFQIAEGFNNKFYKIDIQTNQTCLNQINILQNICPDITCIGCFLTQLHHLTFF